MRTAILAQDQKPSTSIENRASNSSGSVSNANQAADFAVIWHNLTYKVDSRPFYTRLQQRIWPSNHVQSQSQVGREEAREKVILNGVCGDAKSGQLTAILGPSGAGKSSLLYCLFQNRRNGTTGRILVDSPRRNKLKVCFIPQHDYLNEWLTVREDLIFVSRLKLARINPMLREDSNLSSTESSKAESFVRQAEDNSASTSLIDHEANASRVADLLGLSACLDVAVKKISGGQKKRLSIARELMSNPDILILDEPTTGLDSLTCYKTVMVLRDLAKQSLNPMAVIVTIHQPQREVFNLFDKTYFISNKGRVVYEGCPKNVLTTFENVADLRPHVHNYNPASFVIEVSSEDQHSADIDKLEAHQRSSFNERYTFDHLRTLMKSKSTGNQNWKFCAIDEQRSVCSSTSNQPQNSTSIQVNPNLESSQETDLFPKDQYLISQQLSNCLFSHSSNLLQSFRHVFILTHRSWMSIIRNPTFTRIKLAFHTLLPLTMLAIYGTGMGTTNNCPKLHTELSVEEMQSNIKSGLISRNLDEIRLAMQNMSFFFILMYGFAINVISCTASFYPLTMHMFKKETTNGLYSTAPWFVGQMLAELPLEIFYPTLSVMLSYQLSSQLNSFLEWRMFSVAFVMFLVSYANHSLGLLCGSIFVNNVRVSILLGQAFVLPFVMFSGFLVRPSRMPEWMRKLCYTSPFKHGMTGVMASRFGFGVCPCDDNLIPDEGQSITINAMPDNVKHVVEYLFPAHSNQTEPGNNSTEMDYSVTEIFDKLSQKFIKAETFALDLKSCQDVKPYVMHTFAVDDSDLFKAIASLIVFILIFKLITFSIVRSFPYRIK